MPRRELQGGGGLRKLAGDASDHFSWGELLGSDVAERHPKILKQQLDPPFEVQFNLNNLAAMTLEPIRLAMGVPVTVTSGYRCADLNKLIGGSSKSQHVVGEAADIQLWGGFSSDVLCNSTRQDIAKAAEEITGYPVVGSANFYLVAYIALHLDELDIDQVIHEFGRPGRPAWVHVSASRRQNRRQILVATAHGYKRVRLKTLLKLGSSSHG